MSRPQSHHPSLKAQAAAWQQAGMAALVLQVARVQGSTPREVGARMLVSVDQALGSIGGGHLEWQAIAQARQALREHALHIGDTDASASLASWTQHYALGPTLGQCCGGVVDVAFDALNDDALRAWPETQPRFKLDLHGAGHVGQAIVQMLEMLQAPQGIASQVRWIDQRMDHTEAVQLGDRALVGLPSPEALAALPPHIQFISTDDAPHEAAEAPWGSLHLVLTHRHDLDLAIVDALLKRDDVIAGHAWVGLIGSKTKRAAFEHRLLARGHAPEVIARMACPIGVPGIKGKEPAVIAVSVVAQLLQMRPNSNHTL